jgi:outer membrane protein TolC
VDRTHQILKIVSSGATVVLSCTTAVTAQEISLLKSPDLNNPPDLPATNYPVANPEPTTIKLKKEAKKSLSTPTSNVISQATEEAVPPATTAPDNLDSSPNPLSFPTVPDEVRVNPERAITLKEAIELALKNNKEIEVGRLTIDRSRRVLQEANAALYPTLDVQLQATNSKTAGAEISEELGSFTTSGNEDTSAYQGAATLTYNIYTGGSRGANIRRSKRQINFDTLDLERIVAETRFEASRDYYGLQNADAQVEIEQAAVDDANQTLKDAKLLEDAGLGTRFDVLRAEVELADAQQRLNTAMSNQDIARRQLAQTLNLGSKANLKTADEVQEAGAWDLPIEDTIVLAYKNRAELEQFLTQREINAQDRQLALSQIRPQVDVFASYDILDEGDDDVDVADGYTLGARLQWDIFDGGAARARARQSETDINIAESQFANQRDTIRFEVEQAYFSLRSNKENITTSTKAVELAEESLRLARLRFQAGVGTQTDVIDAQSQLTTARGNQITAIIDYNQSLVQLQRAVTNYPDSGLFDLP